MDTTNPVKQAFEVLNQGVTDLIKSEGWETYLTAQATLHNYSFHNAFWLMIQGSQREVRVSHFAGFQSWKKLDRHVKKGEVSFKVLAPCSYKREVEKDEGSSETVSGIAGFKVVSVFDVSQTDGKPLPVIAKTLTEESTEARATFAKLAAWSVSRGVSVTREDAKGPNGFYSRTDNRIVVDEKLSDVQSLKTLAHEVAHSILHATDEGDSRGTKEVEAESTAFVVLHALGFNSGEYSFGYIASWSEGKPEAVKAVATRVQKAAKQILDVLLVKEEEREEESVAA